METIAKRKPLERFDSWIRIRNPDQHCGNLTQPHLCDIIQWCKWNSQYRHIKISIPYMFTSVFCLNIHTFDLIASTEIQLWPADGVVDEELDILGNGVVAALVPGVELDGAGVGALALRAGHPRALPLVLVQVQRVRHRAHARRRTGGAVHRLVITQSAVL